MGERKKARGMGESGTLGRRRPSGRWVPHPTVAAREAPVPTRMTVPAAAGEWLKG